MVAWIQIGGERGKWNGYRQEGGVLGEGKLYDGERVSMDTGRRRRRR